MEKTEETNHPDGDVTEIRWKIMEQKSGGNPWKKNIGKSMEEREDQVN